MFATAERFGKKSYRRIAAALVALAFIIPAWWAAEACGEESGVGGADHPDDTDLPAVSSLPEPAPGPRPILSAGESSSAGAVRRLLRPPRV